MKCLVVVNQLTKTETNFKSKVKQLDQTFIAQISLNGARFRLKKLICEMSIRETNYKVITTVVIGLLDDHTYCALSAFTHLRIWQKRYDCSLHHFTTSQIHS